MKLRRYRPIALVLLVLHLAGCKTWQPTTVGPRQLIEEERPSQVRIFGSNGTQLTLSGPTLQGDSIIGTRERLRRTETLIVPFSGIQGIAVKRLDAWRTLGAILVGPACFIGVVLVACAGGGCDPRLR